jgi:hypothetical protein
MIMKIKLYETLFKYPLESYLECAEYIIVIS